MLVRNESFDFASSQLPTLCTEQDVCVESGYVAAGFSMGMVAVLVGMEGSIA